MDASVFADALTDDSATGRAAFAAVQRDDQWAGPEHVLVETAAAVRGLWLGNRIHEQRAMAAFRFLCQAEVVRVNSALLLARTWELRANLTVYDAAYIAAAETLGVPLLTTDERLVRAPGRRCDVVTP